MALSFLDLVFPKRCVSCRRLGNYICTDCFLKIEFLEHPVCPVCQRQAIGGRVHPGCKTLYTLDGLVVACKYRGPVRNAIKKVKYRWVRSIEKVLVDLLVSQIWRFDLPEDVILVPVPLHIKRERWRGFNQSEILASTLGREFKVQSNLSINRLIDTKAQVRLDRKARKENVKGAFAIARGAKVEGTNIILVDDVYTSGSTMSECAKVLKKAGAKSVLGAAIALG
ncbi:MAG: ComF family protein [Candidatus Curtissbacteria bacterium]|nr:ComF family protein [Candidatus Curtissbacteria bacterium]